MSDRGAGRLSFKRDTAITQHDAALSVWRRYGAVQATNAAHIITGTIAGMLTGDRTATRSTCLPKRPLAWKNSSRSSRGHDWITDLAIEE